MFRITLAAALLTASLSLPALAADAPPRIYSIDASHSEVSFQVKHLVTWVRGQFDGFEGTITVDPQDPANSAVNFTITAASVNTFNEDRDTHLRGADFFDVTTNPTITFASTAVRKVSGERYLVTGDFTMRGVTKSITLPVSFDGELQDPWGGTRAGFSTEATVARKEYGINWNKALDNGGFVLGDDVNISINIEALLQSPSATRG